MPQKQPAKTCLETALAILARREHSTLELRRKLAAKKYPPADIAQTLAFLTGKNYLNDARYAETRARTRAELSKWGPARIRQELAQTGVEKTTAAATLETLSENHDWLATAHKLLARKFPHPLPKAEAADPSLGRAEAHKKMQQEKSRRIAFLTRRGFTLAQALQALGLAETDFDE